MSRVHVITVARARDGGTVIPTLGLGVGLVEVLGGGGVHRFRPRPGGDISDRRWSDYEPTGLPNPSRLAVIKCEQNGNPNSILESISIFEGF